MRMWMFAILGVLLLAGNVRAVTLDSGECMTVGNVTYCAVTCVPVNRTTCSVLIEEAIDNRTAYLEENCMEMENLFNAVKYARDNITKTINSTFATLGPGFLDDLAYYKNETAQYMKWYEECDADLKTYGVIACKENTTQLQDDLNRYKSLYDDIHREWPDDDKRNNPEKNLPACNHYLGVAQGQSNWAWIVGPVIGFGIAAILFRRKRSVVDKTAEGYQQGERMPVTEREADSLMAGLRKRVKGK